MSETRRVDSFRRGSRFRLAHDTKRTGRVIDHGTMGCYVQMDRFVSRTFTTADGEEVTIKKTTEKMTISNASPVVPFKER